MNITADNIELIKKSGIYVDGKNCSVTKVEFVYKNHDAKEPEEIKADEEIVVPHPPVIEGTYTSRVIWQTGDAITSAKGESTEIVYDSNWMSRYGLSDGDPDKLEQAFHLPASLFYTAGREDNIDLDDCIVVTYKSSNPDEEAQGSFYFLDNDNVWFKRGIGDAETVADAYRVDNTVFERYVLNYRTVAALRHNGMWIDGNKGSEVVKVEVRNYSNEALDDTKQAFFAGQIKQEIDPSKEDRGYVVNDTEGNRAFGYDNLKRVRPVAFTNYKNGERIIMTFKKVADDPELRIQYIRPYSSNLKVASGLTGSTEGVLTFENIAADENGLVEVVYRPTQREIRALKFNGLFLDGKGLELNEISFGLENPSDRRSDLYVHNDWMTLGHDGEGKIYEGDLYNSGDAKIYVSYSHFQRAADNNWLIEETGGEYKDYKLTFHFTWSGGGRMTLSYDSENTSDINRDPLNWYYEAAYGSAMPKAPFRAEGDPVVESGTYREIDDIPAGQQVYYDVNLKDDEVRKLMKYGMWVTGGNADLNSILLRSPISVSGVESVTDDEDLKDGVIDFNEPYEAYTIDGRRAADVEAPGLYIVRQGKKVVKIMKR